MWKISIIRSEDASKSFPRPIDARFLSREDRDAVFRAKNRLKDSSRTKDVYITHDYAKAIQQERKVLIKAMFQAKERGLSEKVIDRKLIINNVIYKVRNIPEDLRPPQSSAHAKARHLIFIFFVFPLSRECTAASRIRLSSSETPYGPNQRTFNVLLDLFVYFSLVPFCFWWQYLFSLFSHTN